MNEIRNLIKNGSYYIAVKNAKQVFKSKYNALTALYFEYVENMISADQFEQGAFSLLV